MTALVPPWPPLIQTQGVRLRSNVGLFVSPLTGLIQRTARPGSRWEFDVAFSSVEDTRGYDWRGFLSRAQDEAATFLWSPYPRGLPLNYPSGTGWGTTPLVNGGSQTGRTLVTDGWTAGTLFARGDFVAFNNGTFREMKIITAAATANGSGQVTLSIAPAIVRTPADNAAIYFNGNDSDDTKRCACEVMVDPSSPFDWSVEGYQTGMNFKLIEAIR